MDLSCRWPLQLCQLILTGSILPASLQVLSHITGKRKKKKLSVMLLSFTFSFFFFFFFFNYCLIKLPHKPQILLCLIFFIFLLRPSYATPGKILFLGKLCSAFLAARRLQLPPRAVLFCFLMYRSCRKHHPTGSRNKSPFNRLSQLL